MRQPSIKHNRADRGPKLCIAFKHYDAHATYVAMTRHRKSCDVFLSH